MSPTGNRKGRSKFGDVIIFFPLHFSFSILTFRLLECLCFHRKKISMLKKMTRMHFSTFQFYVISTFRTTPPITWQYAVFPTARQDRKEPNLNSAPSALTGSINASDSTNLIFMFSHYHVSTRHLFHARDINRILF